MREVEQGGIAEGTERAHGHPWQAVMQASQPLLAELPAGSKLTVVVSNQWLRYKLLPAMPPMQSQAASLAIAREMFMETYGDAASQWRIQLAPLPQGDSQFACAMDQALLKAIGSMAEQSGCRLVSVQPAMMQAYNLIYRQQRGLSCLVQVEPGRIHLAMLRDGHWLGLSACASQAQDWPRHLVALLQRETLRLGDAPQLPGSLFLHAASSIALSTAWPALQGTLAEMGWQASPIFTHAPAPSAATSFATPAWGR